MEFICDRYVDWLNVMAYDYHGAWMNTTGFNAPLFAGLNDYGDEFPLNVVSQSFGRSVDPSFIWSVVQTVNVTLGQS